MNLNEVKAERQDVYLAADALLQRAKTNKKDLAGADLAQYNAFTAQLKVLDKQIAECEQVANGAQWRSGPRGPTEPYGPRYRWNRLPIFRKGESVAAHMRQEFEFAGRWGSQPWRRVPGNGNRRRFSRCSQCPVHRDRQQRRVHRACFDLALS